MLEGLTKFIELNITQETSSSVATQLPSILWN
jgi:hypothetical protein